MFFFDYGGVPYPEGLIGDQMAYFNHENIARILFSGFKDEDDKIIIDNINRYLEGLLPVQYRTKYGKYTTMG